MSDAGRRRWAEMSGDHRQEVIKNVSEGRKRDTGPSGFEVAVRKVLDDLGVRWLSGMKVSGFFPDLFLPEGNILVEVNGCYWHACSTCFPDHNDADRMHLRDRRKIGAYRKAGYACLMLWEHDFLLDPAGSVMRVIEGVI